MKTRALGIACAGMLVASCTPEQIVRVQSYQDRIAGACSVAMSLSAIAGPIAPYIIGGCATEGMIARLALDPSSLQWVEDLIRKARGN